MANTNDDATKLMDLLERMSEPLIKYLGELAFDKSHPWHRNVVVLYATMIELNNAVT